MSRNSSNAERLIESVRMRLDLDLDSFPNEITTVFGQAIQILDEKGCWASNIKLEHIGFGVKRVQWKYRFHDDDYVEWISRSWLIHRLQSRLDLYPVVDALNRLGSLQIDCTDPEAVEESLFAWIKSNVSESVMRGAQATAIGVRLLYRWCVEDGLPWFSEFRLLELDRFQLSGRSAEHLVSMRDAREGPLTRIELEKIEQGLISVPGVTARQKAMYYLGRDWGIRPIQMALLRKEDYGRDNLGPYILVPSVKGIRRSRLRRAAGNMVRRYISEDTAVAIEEQIDAAKIEASQVSTRYVSMHMDRYGVAPEEASPLFPTVARTDDRLMRFCSNPRISGYAIHADSTQLSRELIRLTGLLKIQNIRLRVESSQEEILEISAYRLRRTKGTSMVLSGATPEEVAAALDHESIATVAHYFRYNAELHDFINQVHASSPEIGEAVRLWQGRFVQDDVGDTDSYKIGDLGKCKRGGPCPYHPKVTCYACHSFRPSRNANHRAALKEIEIFQVDIAGSSTGPIQQQLEAAIWGAKAIIKVIELGLEDDAPG